MEAFPWASYRKGNLRPFNLKQQRIIENVRFEDKKSVLL